MTLSLKQETNGYLLSNLFPGQTQLLILQHHNRNLIFAPIHIHNTTVTTTNYINDMPL